MSPGPRMSFLQCFPLKDIFSLFLNGDLVTLHSLLLCPSQNLLWGKKLTSFMICPLFFPWGVLSYFVRILYRSNSRGMWPASGHSEMRRHLSPLYVEKIQWKNSLPDKRQLPCAMLPGTPGYTGPQVHEALEVKENFDEKSSLHSPREFAEFH